VVPELSSLATAAAASRWPLMVIECCPRDGGGAPHLEAEDVRWVLAIGSMAGRCVLPASNAVKFRRRLVPVLIGTAIRL
jgi:hypothetical protein